LTIVAGRKDRWNGNLEGLDNFDDLDDLDDMDGLEDLDNLDDLDDLEGLEGDTVVGDGFASFAVQDLFTAKDAKLRTQSSQRKVWRGGGGVRNKVEGFGV
jgi:hypothetical protein